MLNESFSGSEAPPAVLLRNVEAMFFMVDWLLAAGATGSLFRPTVAW